MNKRIKINNKHQQLKYQPYIMALFKKKKEKKVFFMYFQW